MENFSEYIVYADESGDHSLTKIDQTFPIFVLSLCIFEKRHYVTRIVPSFQSLKLRYFGHDLVIFHEREIRKQLGDFSMLRNSDVRTSFFSDLESCVKRARFKVAAATIDKRDVAYDLFPENPYEIAMIEALDILWRFLDEKKASGQTNVVFESRGPKEDRDLEIAFLRRSGEIRRETNGRIDLVFRVCSKKANSTGLQIADLTARPIGINKLNSRRVYKPYEILKAKLLRKSRLR